MASRPILSPFKVVTNGDMSGSIVSKATVIQNVSMVSYDVSWSGTAPSGTITVEASNTFTQNADGSVRDAGNWSTLTLSVTPVVSGNTGTGFIDIDEMAGYALRLRYTRTSGTGVLNVTINGKVS